MSDTSCNSEGILLFCEDWSHSWGELGEVQHRSRRLWVLWESQNVSHPKSEMWPARGKHTPMLPKPWPTSYLFKIRHDLAHSGRLPTCKQHNPQVVIHHTTCTQSISIINYIFIHIILKCIQRYQLSNKFLYDIWYNNTTHDKINNTWRPKWQYTDPPPRNGTHFKSNPCSPLNRYEQISKGNWRTWSI